MKAIGVLFVFAFTLSVQVHAQSAEKWGDTVQGVRVSMAVSDNVVEVGATNIIECHVENNSTNTVCFWGIPEIWTQVFLIDTNNQKFRLTFDPSNNPGGGPSHCVDPNGKLTLKIPVAIRKRFSAGVYALQASVPMFTVRHRPTKDDDGIVNLEPTSNLVSVTLK